MLKEKDSLCKDTIFDSFYRENSQSLHNFMFYRCGDKQRALDLVQEAFIKLWDKCSEVSLNKAKSYLFQTANNLFLNEARHEKVVLEYNKLHPVKESTQQDPEFILREKEFNEKLQNAIANLSDGQREVFLLNRIDGKKYKEIAEMLGVSTKAVEKRMMGALKKLREEFEYFRR
ncbi:sigma-70 family RNA polymerase sigma factor [Galbibacter sp. EGI 63066]|uniref:RNA polymerase sigma factor n=1 Tax=Galbibacter sp. EGI 63066 TaxID=2993559 RepID=UPI002248F58B|nr:sigma-70 family RNA polymerase sigma factor [Galbibacter sp. EGI 63066]MCX2680915.1 sigma-70 family RNA polymerase sigma factor [Galbibacter sp. EGI 63066]